MLRLAVASTYQADCYISEFEWKHSLKKSDVLLQWDPDHAPDGTRLARRAIQLGLRGQTVRQHTHDWIIDIEDISEFVSEQRQNIGKYTLLTPREEIYIPRNPMNEI